jgi:peptidylprolyl isomerase
LRAVSRLTRFSSIALAAACLGLAACGSGSTKTADIPSGGATGSSAASTPTTASTTATTAAPTLGAPTPEIKALAAAVGTDTKKKPKIGKPKGKPPTQLVVIDVVDGKGPAAKNGDTLTADYAGNSWSTGKQFDASWGKSPFPVVLGQGSVIQGWDQGLVGMKAGGRRMLVIPGALAYGASGRPPTIAPNETLVFVIDLRKIG